jgi:hypothetical protein
MAVTVGVNNMSVVHASSSGISTAFPDVCKTPTPAGPVPIPYPNIAKSGDSDKATKKVKCDGEAVCVSDSNFSTSSGDEAGQAGGGVVSSKTKGKAEFVNYSFDVKFEGKGVARAMDLMLHNDKNTPPFPVMQGPVVTRGGDTKSERECAVCDEHY